MRRSIGNANRKVKKPAKQGKHHQSGTQTFFRYWTVCSELVTLGLSTRHSNSLSATVVPGKPRNQKLTRYAGPR
jgi:hypothetical protein